MICANSRTKILTCMIAAAIANELQDQHSPWNTKNVIDPRSWVRPLHVILKMTNRVVSYAPGLNTAPDGSTTIVHKLFLKMVRCLVKV